MSAHGTRWSAMGPARRLMRDLVAGPVGGTHRSAMGPACQIDLGHTYEIPPVEPPARLTCWWGPPMGPIVRVGWWDSDRLVVHGCEAEFANLNRPHRYDT
jgi:hypothetical protein